MGDPIEVGEDLIPKIRTRSGYEVDEVIRAFQVTLGETGPLAAGRCIHYSADIVCSGALNIWMKYCMEYAIDHIGAGSPRIFMYLKKRFNEIDILSGKYDSEILYTMYEFQAKVCEIVLIIKDCIRRTKVALPKIHPSCFSELWLTEARTTRTNYISTQHVYNLQTDSNSMAIVGNEIVKAVEEGGTEAALFWMRWLLDEDASRRKLTKMGLSSSTRSVGFYLCSLAIEIYNDLAARGRIRMTEEFTAIAELYRIPSKVLTARRRLDLLSLLFQLLCEVPRWRVPAAPVLVKDPVVMRRGLAHLENFFHEVLDYKMPTIDIIKEAKKAKKAIKKKGAMTDKRTALEHRLSAFDAAIDDFMNKH